MTRSTVPHRLIGSLTAVTALVWLAWVAEAATGPTAVSHPQLETGEKDLDELRRGNLSPLPDAQADYVFGADQAKPAWEGMGGMQLLKDYFGSGADGVEFTVGPEGRDGFYRPSAVYWSLADIRPGRYWLGLWLESQDVTLPTEYSVARLLTCAYLNGWPVRFSTSTEPAQVRPGVWLAELQSAEAVELKPGDEIAIRTMWQATCFLRLALHRNEPKRGHGVTGQTFGCMGQDIFPRLRLAVQADLVGSGEAGTPHEARMRVVNPLPYAADAEVVWTLADYFGAPLTSRTDRVQLAPHATREMQHAFLASGDARAYQLDVKTRPTPGFQSPAPRPRELIELNDWARLEFLPNLPGPLEDWCHTRLDLRTDNQGGRMAMSLDGGDWELGPLAGRRVPVTAPADIQWTPCRVPNVAHSPLPKGVFGMWFRKKFRLPDWMKGERIEIEVESATHERTVFLNGNRVGTDTYCGDGPDLSVPLRVDVTQAVSRDGENELAILVRGPIALMKDDYVDRYDPENAWMEAVTAHLDRPNGARNVAFLGPVRLRSLPAVHVRQTLVLPDVARKTLNVFSRVENTRATPCTVQLRYEVFQEGNRMDARIPPRTITVKPGETVEVRATGRGKGLKPYTPAHPVLSKVATTLLENGAPVDVEAMRFGYRTIKVEGDHLELNGEPVFLFGSGPLNRMQECVERENGMQTSRGTSCGVGLPYLDEIGRLIYPPNGSGNVVTWDALNNDRLWERECAKAVETVWAHGSKPCCVGWDLGNENYFYSVYHVGLDGQAKGGERMFSVAEAIRRQLWPHFWLMSDGDTSLGGRLDFTSWHYLNHGWSHGYAASARSFRDDKYGVSHYPPDCFFVDGAASPPRRDTVVHGTSAGADDWHPGMACADTEEFWFVSQNNGPAISKYIGDRAAVSSAWQFYSGRGMWWSKLSLEGYRDMGQTAILSLYPINFLNVVIQNVTFSLPQQEIRYYSGARFDKRLNLYDSEFAPGSLEFVWRLMTQDGRIISKDTLKVRSTTSYLKRTRISFPVPEVTRRTTYVLDMEMSKNGRVREHEQRVMEVWPAAASYPKAGGYDRMQNLVIFDPSNTTPSVLATFGVNGRHIAVLDQAALQGAKILIVGPNCVTPAMVAEQQIVKTFAEGGGRVFVLPQQDAALLPADTHLEKRGRATMGFVRVPGHPVMRGLTDMDFAMWNPGHLIASGFYRTPNRGNVLALVDCGHESLTWTPLLEVYLGKGSILATQLPLVEDLDTEPMAAEMWRRILGYLAEGAPYRHAEVRLAVLEGASAPLAARLKEIRADFEWTTAVEAGRPVTLVELNQTNFAPQTEAFRTYVQNGGTLLLHRARPEHQGWLAALTGRKVEVEVQPYRSWVDRQILEKRDGLAEGLNNVDFYWRPNVGGEGWDSQSQVSAGVADGKGQVEYLVKVEGAKDYLFPGGWVEVTLGKGRIVLDQVKWEVPEKEKNDYGSPMRVVSMLLSNLGVVQRPPQPKPALPKDVIYAPVDQSALVNRGIRDDVPGDGAGWVDWGPGQDLRDFPVGDVRFDGIPFRIATGEKNAIVLRANPGYVKSLAAYPESVVIPVGKANVAGLYFLHTGGWTGGVKPYAYRIVRYADSSEERMAMNANNTGDWNYGHDEFPEEEGTASRVAWKGSCKMYPVTRVYMTLWKNPHPEKTIREVVLTEAGLPAEGHAFLAQLGITAALLPATSATAGPTTVRAPARARTLLQEALALRADKQTAEALARLHAAVQADDQNVSVWVTLTGLRGETDSVEAFTALCRQWFHAMPANYQAHNVLGKFLEDHGAMELARAEYEKSLELEWNQPPTIQAMRRLQKRLDH